MWDIIRDAKRPLLLAGPLMCNPAGRAAMGAASVALGVPVIGIESPRGTNDPSLGTFADVLKDADLVVLLSKPHDFTLRFCAPPFVSASARFVVLDPDPVLLAASSVRRRAASHSPLTPMGGGARAVRGMPAHMATGWLHDVMAAVTLPSEDWRTATAAQARSTRQP